MDNETIVYPLLTSAQNVSVYLNVRMCIHDMKTTEQILKTCD